MPLQTVAAPQLAIRATVRATGEQITILGALRLNKGFWLFGNNSDCRYSEWLLRQVDIKDTAKFFQMIGRQV